MHTIPTPSTVCLFLDAVESSQVKGYPLGSQGLSRISSLCVCAIVLFVYKTVCVCRVSSFVGLGTILRVE